MSDDRLEQIREDHDARRWFGGGAKHEDVGWLLDEVERLRAAIAAHRDAFHSPEAIDPVQVSRDLWALIGNYADREDDR